MKNVKKIIGLLLVMTLALCMSIPAFAETTGTITIGNLQDGKEYNAYKIFDVIYDTENKNYAYTIEDGSPWLATVQTYASTADNGLTVKAVDATDPTLYTVEIDKTKFSAAKFADALYDAKITEDAIAFTNGVANVEIGYYFVTTTTGSVCNLTTADPDVTIYDKNAGSAIEKSSDEQGLVEVGQKVTYTVEGTVPSTTGYTTFTYKVSDTMTAGLTFNKDVALTIGGDVVDVAGLVAYPDDVNGFVLTLDMTNYQDGDFAVGDAIVVTYSANVNEAAITTGDALTNEAVLEYSNDPNNGSSTTQATKAVVDLDTCNVTINKYDAANAETKLDGAEFKLYRKNAQDAKEYYYWNAEARVVEWKASADDASVMTTDDGVAVFNGLGDGKYYLEEIKAPAGYNRLNEPVEFEITNETAKTIDVPNNAGSLLPSTGGIGTQIFYIVGIALIAGAFILLVTKKRMSTEK